MILDSNILIYAANPDGEFLTRWVEAADACIAVVSRIEVLGFPRWHLLEARQQMRLEVVVNSLVAIPLNDALEQAAIDLRRKRKMSLADAIVAATALAQGGGWVTRNVEDYRHIAGLRVLNPFNPS